MQDDDQYTGITIATAIRRGMAYTTDSRGRIIEASFPHPLVIDQLRSANIIDAPQYYHAVHFAAMRRVFLRPLSNARDPLEQDSPGEQPPKPEFPIEDNDYLKVLRQMPHDSQRNIVREACDDFADSVTFNRLSSTRMQAQVRDSFRALATAVDFLIDKKRQARDAEQKLAQAEKKLLALRSGVCLDDDF